MAQVVGPREAHDLAGRRPHPVVVSGQMKEGWGEGRWPGDGWVLVGEEVGRCVGTSARRLTATRARQLSPGLFPPSLPCYLCLALHQHVPHPTQPQAWQNIHPPLPLLPRPYLAVRFRSPAALPVVDVSPSKPW